MYRWNTSVIEGHLKQIPGVTKVTVNGPGGDVDTDNIVLTVDGSGDSLFIAGFEVDSMGELPDKSDVDVDMVELTDGQCGSGGLNSDDFRTAQAFIHVRQYFVVNGANVVDSMKAYF